MQMLHQTCQYLKVEGTSDRWPAPDWQTTTPIDGCISTPPNMTILPLENVPEWQAIAIVNNLINEYKEFVKRQSCKHCHGQLSDTELNRLNYLKSQLVGWVASCVQ